MVVTTFSALQEKVQYGLLQVRMAPREIDLQGRSLKTMKWAAKPSDVLREMMAGDLNRAWGSEMSSFSKEQLMVVTTFSALQEKVQYGLLQVRMAPREIDSQGQGLKTMKWAAKPSGVLREMMAGDLNRAWRFEMSCFSEEQLMVVTTFSALQEEVQYGFLQVRMAPRDIDSQGWTLKTMKWAAKPSGVLREMMAGALNRVWRFEMSCFPEEQLMVVTIFSELQEEVQYGFLHGDLVQSLPV